MIRDANATRQRLITAAQTEFAAFGIAGARVDRIALNSGSNKAQIYHYFGNKDALYDAVWQNLVSQVLSETTIDVTDLPGYAARLADLYAAHPEFIRLIAWQRLERSEGRSLPLSVSNIEAHVAAIAQAQADGIVTDRFEAGTLYAMILHLATLWGDMSPDVRVVVGTPEASDRASTVSRAVASILAPPPEPGFG